MAVLIATTDTSEKSDIRIFSASSPKAARAFIKRWEANQAELASDLTDLNGDGYPGQAIIIRPSGASNADNWRMSDD